TRAREHRAAFGVNERPRRRRYIYVIHRPQAGPVIPLDQDLRSLCQLGVGFVAASRWRPPGKGAGSAWTGNPVVLPGGRPEGAKAGQAAEEAVNQSSVRSSGTKKRAGPGGRSGLARWLVRG